MKRIPCLCTSLLGSGIALIAASLEAQQLTPAWEHLITESNLPLPILTAQAAYATDEDAGDGKAVMETLGPLIRYDANRLLLGIRENGIDESSAGANLALAAQYPDRSLLWINPTNGEPMGIALTIGLRPVPLDPDFVAAGGVADQYWWTYEVGPDGAIYSGYKNKILRYARTPAGEISQTPAVVFTLTQEDLTSRGIDGATWANWRWARISVIGTGADTRILAGATASNRGNMLLTTTDGNAFAIGSLLNVGGATMLLPSQDAAAPNDLWAYGGLYPGNSNGSDSSYSRYNSPPPFTDNFTRDTSFTPPSDLFAYPERFRNDFVGALDGDPGLNYIAVYSTPSWNSRAVVGTPRPGWLALVGHDGRLRSSHQLRVTEDAELLATDQASLFYGTVGFISLSKLASGEVEVLWSGSIYGYGRYLVTPYGPETVTVPEGGRGPGLLPNQTVSAANWVASGGPAFDGNVSINQQGQGPAPWSISRYNRGDFAVRLSPVDPSAAQENFDMLGEYPGDGTAAMAPEQAWTPNGEAGVLIPTARVNGPVNWNDGLGGFYPVVAASVGGSSGYGYNMVSGNFERGGPDVQTGKAGDQSANPSPEGNFNFATAWFPYAQGWLGAAVDNPDAEGNPRFANGTAHAPGLDTNVVSWPEINNTRGGTSILSLPGVNSVDDGMLFATSIQGGSDVKIISVAPLADGSWAVSARRASEPNPETLATTDSQYQFVYVPFASERLVGGHVRGDGTVRKSAGQFTLSRTAAGTYNLVIPGKSGTNGVLLLQSADLLPGSTNVATANYLSYQYNEGANAFVIESRRTEANNSFPLVDGAFYFAWVDFATPLTPPVKGTTPPPTAPTLTVTKSGATAVITWSAGAAGYTLERTTALSGLTTTWQAIGVVGEGALANSYTVPAGSTVEFYRLRK